MTSERDASHPTRSPRAPAASPTGTTTIVDDLTWPSRPGGSPDRRPQRLRQVDPAAGPGPAARARPRRRAPRRPAIEKMPTREVATASASSAEPGRPEGITVADLVGRGRYPHQSWFRRWSPADDEAVVAGRCDHRHARPRHRPVDELSGGQRQRVWIAMALAQRTDLLLLDEPTTFLDLAHQVDVLDLLADLQPSARRTMVIVLHDLNLAARYADHLVAMRAGRILARGGRADIVTEELVGEVFGMRCSVIERTGVGHPDGGSAGPPPARCRRVRHVRLNPAWSPVTARGGGRSGRCCRTGRGPSPGDRRRACRAAPRSWWRPLRPPARRWPGRRPRTRGAGLGTRHGRRPATPSPANGRSGARRVAQAST